MFYHSDGIDNNCGYVGIYGKMNLIDLMHLWSMSLDDGLTNNTTQQTNNNGLSSACMDGLGD